MGALLICVLFLALAAPVPAAAVDAAPSPPHVFELIRARFRSHRPPPPFETYTLTRSQKRANGTVDATNSYRKKVWIRNSDRAALTRVIGGNGKPGPLAFDRPAFNEARDPGPPTADMFESTDESDYRVDSLEAEGDRLHLRVSPVHDAERNRLRDIYADRTTYELRLLVAADKLFVTGGPVFPVALIMTVDAVQNVPVVTTIRGVVGGGFNGDGRELDYTFSEIAFPDALPDWYFDPRTYREHSADAPV